MITKETLQKDFMVNDMTETVWERQLWVAKDRGRGRTPEEQ